MIFAGDAARTGDPITGEGVDQAMRSGHASALALHQAFRGKRQPVGLGARSRAQTNDWDRTAP